MAARLGLSGHDQLQHFIASPAWDDGPLWRVLAEQADRLVGGPEAVLVIDDTALPKKGTLSVGVARQYCGQLGKRANCQALVSLTLAGREVPVPVGLAAVPAGGVDRRPGALRRSRRAGGEVALPAARARSRWPSWTGCGPPGVRFGIVLADAGYGASAAFRHGLDERGLPGRWASRATRRSTTADVRLVPPGGRKRRPVPDQEPRAAEAVLAGLPLAPGDLAAGHQGGARRPLRRDPRPRGRWRDLGQQPPPAGRGGLAGRRMALEWRAQILPQQPAAADLRCAPWPARSRRAGSASRRTSSSSRNSGSAISKAAPGRACTGTR